MGKDRVPIWKRGIMPSIASTSTQGARKYKAVNWLPVSVLAILASWFCGYRIFQLPHPPVGLYIGVLAFTAGVVTIWPPERPWAKALWFLVFGGFLVLEISTLYQQRAEDQATAENNRQAENKRFEAVLSQNQQDFQATMNSMESVLGKQDKTLLQTMGGPAFPLFLPVYPAVPSSNGPVLAVKVINSVNTRGRPVSPLPLVDVNVDLSIQPHNGNYQEAGNSMLHSPHYNLGTILPGIFETPIQLQVGKIYELMITTRRGFFRETIDIANEKSLNWCMYSS